MRYYQGILFISVCLVSCVLSVRASNLIQVDFALESETLEKLSDEETNVYLNKILNQLRDEYGNVLNAPDSVHPVEITFFSEKQEEEEQTQLIDLCKRSEVNSFFWITLRGEKSFGLMLSGERDAVISVESELEYMLQEPSLHWSPSYYKISDDYIAREDIEWEKMLKIGNSATIVDVKNLKHDKEALDKLTVNLLRKWSKETNTHYDFVYRPLKGVSKVNKNWKLTIFFPVPTDAKYWVCKGEERIFSVDFEKVDIGVLGYEMFEFWGEPLDDGEIEFVIRGYRRNECPLAPWKNSLEENNRILLDLFYEHVKKEWQEEGEYCYLEVPVKIKASSMEEK